MSIVIEHIVFDCANAAKLADFWAGVLRLEVDAEANEYFATVNKSGEGVALMFIQVPEPRTGKNRLHVDLATADWETEVDRLLALGANRHSEHDEYGTHWLTLTDPEGSLFDLADHRN